MILPTGTVTFLFSDIEGSTPLWEQHPEQMAEALEIHNNALRQAIEKNGGVVFKIVGDSFQAAFATALQALRAAIDGQKAIMEASWNDLGPLRVRMGLHTGEAQLDPGGDEYAVSHTKNRVARIMSAAHGGQILLSQECTDLVQRSLPDGVSLKDLGEHRLKGLSYPERLYQVIATGLPQEFPPLSTSIKHLNNLPVQRTSFIGREAQVRQVKELVRQHALVTLTGSGGVGKTRLSLQAAGELLNDFPDGVWLVELAAVTEPGMVPQAVATVLGLESMGRQPIRQNLLEYLQTRQVLLVLDNCEHLIEACSALVDELLGVCHHLMVLASSREALGVAGEVAYRVPSMSLPNSSQMSDLPELGQFEALQLFTERTRLARSDFKLTKQNTPIIVQICQRLDGIPLAIELAAARMNILTSEQLVQNLDQAFRLLTGGVRTALPRQQTLRATIDWSYRLLSPAEQELLRRLSVFNGTFDLQAVQAVCCLEKEETLDLLDVLNSLANKSMLSAEHVPGMDMRYRLLETVRQYAREKLIDAGESLRVHDYHAQYYLDLALQGGQNTFTRHAPAWLRRLDIDFPNLRAAFSWALESEYLDQGIEALLSLRYYWLLRSCLDEGRSFLQKALKRLDPEQPSRARAGLLRDLGLLIMLQGNNQEGRYYCKTSQEIFRELGDRSGYAWATVILSSMEGVVSGLHEESATIFAELGDEQSLAFVYWLWGFNVRDTGDLVRAEKLLKESERLYQKMGSWKLGDVYFNLATVYHRKGQSQQARALFSQAVPLLQEVGDQWGLMWCRWFMGCMWLSEAGGEEDLRNAEIYLLESLDTAQKIGNQFNLNFQIPILLAKIALKLKDYTQAMVWLRQALNLFQSYGTSSYNDHLSEIEQCFISLAETATYLDNPAFSARLLGALQGIRESKPKEWDMIIHSDFQRLRQTVQDDLGEEEYLSTYSIGKRLTLEQAVALVLETQFD